LLLVTVTAVVHVVSSGSITINDDSSVQILAEEACSVDELDAQVSTSSLPVKLWKMCQNDSVPVTVKH